MAVVVLGSVVFGLQAWRAVSALGQAEDVAAKLANSIVSGDVRAARAHLDQFDDEATRAHRATDGPIWWLGSRAPYLGRSIGALRVVAAQADAVADEALPGLVDVADRVQLETFRPQNGRIDLVAVRRALPALTSAQRVMASADAEIGAIDVDGLQALVRQPIGEVQARVHEAASATKAVYEAARLMPSMLGGDGRTRTYLMLMLNNAEVRSLAGMPGSVAVIEARRGKLRIGKQGGIHDLPPLPQPALPIKQESAGGFATTVGADMRDTTSIPTFPRAAELTAAVVGETWEEKYDGVVAVDPVALSHVLGGLGPVDVGDGITLNQGNAAAILLNGVYLKYPTDFNRQDDVFESAARRTFDALTSGRGNSIRTVRALVQGVREGRIMLWSREADEQRRIRRTGISGEWSTDRGTPEVGFFVNDSGSTKMEYYLRMGSNLRSVRCWKEGVETLKLTSTIRSEAQQGVPLPTSITGLETYVPRGVMGLHAMVLAPPGGKIRTLRVDGVRAPVGATYYRGRHVARVAQHLSPEQASVIEAEIQTAPGPHEAAVLRTTPGVVNNDDVVDTRACD